MTVMIERPPHDPKLSHILCDCLVLGGKPASRTSKVSGNMAQLLVKKNAPVEEDGFVYSPLPGQLEMMKAALVDAEVRTISPVVQDLKAKRKPRKITIDKEGKY